MGVVCADSPTSLNLSYYGISQMRGTGACGDWAPACPIEYMNVPFRISTTLKMPHSVVTDVADVVTADVLGDGIAACGDTTVDAIVDNGVIDTAVASTSDTVLDGSLDASAIDTQESAFVDASVATGAEDAHSDCVAGSDDATQWNDSGIVRRWLPVDP